MKIFSSVGFKKYDRENGSQIWGPFNKMVLWTLSIISCLLNPSEPCQP